MSIKFQGTAHANNNILLTEKGSTGLDITRGGHQRADRSRLEVQRRSGHGSQHDRGAGILRCLRRSALDSVDAIVSLGTATNLGRLARVIFVVRVQCFDLAFDVHGHLVVMDANFVGFSVPLATEDDSLYTLANGR